MTIANKLLLERAVGTIEGIAYAIDNKNIAEGLFNVCELFDSVIKSENEVQGE